MASIDELIDYIYQLQDISDRDREVLLSFVRALQEYLRSI